MKYFAITNLACLFLTSLFLFTGCKTKNNLPILTEKQNLQLPSQDNCEGKFNDELTNVLLEKIEENSVDDEDFADFLLNPQWTKRLGDDATYFININKQLNKQKVALLNAKTDFAKSGVVINPCQMDEVGKLNISVAEQRNVQNNFPSLIESFNETVQKRSEIYEKKLESFQNDFQGTDFIIKQKKSVNQSKKNSVNRSVDKKFLMKLYQNRIKHLLHISRG